MVKAVCQIVPSELKTMLEQRKVHHLLDVRTLQEWECARIPEAKLLCKLSQNETENLGQSDCLVFHCHHGGRSQQAAEQFAKRGFKNVYNLAGGIDAWSLEIDPSIPRY